MHGLQYKVLFINRQVTETNETAESRIHLCSRRAKAPYGLAVSLYPLLQTQAEQSGLNT